MSVLGKVRSAGRSASWCAYMSFHSSNVKLPFLTTRCQYQGDKLDLPGDLPVDQPIWALTVVMINCYSWPLDISTRRGRSASWSAYMSFHSSDVKLPFLTTRYQYLDGVRSAGRSASWSAYMSYNSSNVKLQFLTTRCQYLGQKICQEICQLICLYELSQ